VQPIEIEANRLETDISPSLLQIWNPDMPDRSKTISKPTTVEVQNAHNTISPYKQSVYFES
jgi:hypothetical protein